MIIIVCQSFFGISHQTKQSRGRHFSYSEKTEWFMQNEIEGIAPRNKMNKQKKDLPENSIPTR
jgi:hypothetical protein